MNSGVWLFRNLRSVFDASSRKHLVGNPHGLSTGARRARSARSGGGVRCSFGCSPRFSAAPLSGSCWLLRSRLGAPELGVAHG